MFFIDYIKKEKQRLYIKFIMELKQFLIHNANNKTLNKRIFSLYYFLSCHASYDDLIISLNRFIEAKKFYSFGELMIVRLLKLKLEFPILGINHFIKG